MLSFFFNDTATTEIYTLSLHDALPIYNISVWWHVVGVMIVIGILVFVPDTHQSADFVFTERINNSGFSDGRDRKSTRLNSSHANISYAVFCLKKNKYKPWASTLRSIHL